LVKGVCIEKFPTAKGTPAVISAEALPLCPTDRVPCRRFAGVSRCDPGTNIKVPAFPGWSLRGIQKCTECLGVPRVDLAKS
jgi:hypothetical protein